MAVTAQILAGRALGGRRSCDGQRGRGAGLVVNGHPVGAAGLWESPSSPPGELVALGASCKVPHEGTVKETQTRSKDSFTE